MTTAESCGLIVTLTRDLSEARREASVWRLMALTAVQSTYEQHVDIERLERAVDQLRTELRERMGITARALSDLEAERAA